MANASSAERTPDQIEADIAATRERLASTVDELVDRTSPRNVLRRQTERARSQVYDADGRLRTQRLATLVGTLVGVIAMLLLVRRMVGRR